ncbi:MAG TPA: hypothetical protein VIK91_18480, partial [Nannocystis sp.]
MSLALRDALAREIARYFYRHLREELGKPEALRAQLRFDGLRAGEATRIVLTRLLAEFPGVDALPPAPFNLFEEWARRNRFIYRYDEYIFDLYSRVFITRLLALHRPTPERVQAFRDTTLTVFRAIDPGQPGFSISFFLRVENNMRELLREIARSIDGLDLDAAWQLIFEQSKEYQELTNEVFERRLK